MVSRFFGPALLLAALLSACGEPADACKSDADCNDSNVCTTDTCAASRCSHAAVSVDDANACTLDACSPASGVTHTRLAVDDGNACTVDACDPATGVAHTLKDIDDGDPCTQDVCNAATGIESHPPVVLDDNDACTLDACTQAAGLTHTPVTVDDGNPCTVDACTPAGGVTHVAVVIDDGNACTVDACDGTTGAVTHVSVVIDDNNACTVDACDTTTGAVTHAPNANISDNDGCTADACDRSTGAVTHAAIDVTDSDPCTQDLCVSTGPNTFTIQRPSVVVDDGNACTVDACTQATGLTHTPVPVDDGNACTVDTCDGLTGIFTHTPINPTDAFACTVDACDPATGAITHTPDHARCNDTIACTTDSCIGTGGNAQGCVFARQDLLCAVGNVCSASGCSAQSAGDQQGGVIFTEFRALGGQEFIEVKNVGTASVNLFGYTVRNAADVRATIRATSDRAAGNATPVTLAPGAVAWGVANPSGSIVGTPSFVFGSAGTSFSLADTGDQLMLYDAVGTLEDVVDFRAFHTSATTAQGATAFPGFSGRSTQLGSAETAIGNDSGAAWCVTYFPAAGVKRRVNDSAGAANAACDVVVVNEVLFDPAGTDDGLAFVELAGPGGADVGGWRVEDVEGRSTTAGQRNPSASADQIVLPAGTRIPVDGILLIADELSTGGTTLVSGFTAGVDVIVRDADFENGGGDSLQLVRADLTLADAVGHDAAGVALDVTTATFNTLAMAEGAVALYPPGDASLARATDSTDTQSNVADFHADPSPTPGTANDVVNVTVTSLAPSSGPAGVTTSVVFTGTDLSNSMQATFGATTPANCTRQSPTQVTCTAPANGGVAARVDVTVTSPASVGASPIVLSQAFTWTGLLNETDTPPEADFCVIQFPAAFTVSGGAATPLIYGRIFETGVTEAAGAPAGVVAEIGYGLTTTFSNWSFVPMTFNVQVGNDDEFQGNFTAPTVTGGTTYRYAVRFSQDNGINWTYCDADGAGSNGGLTLDTAQLGTMTVNP